MVASTRVVEVPPVAVPKPRDADNSNAIITLFWVEAAFAESDAVINPPDAV